MLMGLKILPTFLQNLLQFFEPNFWQIFLHSLHILRVCLAELHSLCHVMVRNKIPRKQILKGYPESNRSTNSKVFRFDFRFLDRYKNIIRVVRENEVRWRYYRNTINELLVSIFLARRHCLMEDGRHWGQIPWRERKYPKADLETGVAFRNIQDQVICVGKIGP